MAPDSSTRHKNVFITGGSQGLGQELAQMLASKGAHVTIFARRKERLNIAQSDIIAQRLHPNQEINAVSLDLRDPAAVASVFASQPQIPDTLICAAGCNVELGFLADLNAKDLETCMESNYFTAAYAAQALLKIWINDDKNKESVPKSPNEPARHRQIIFINSAAAFAAVPGYIAYNPARAALRALADTLRMEIMRYSSTKSTYTVHCAFPSNFMSPQFLAEQSLKPALTKQIEGTTASIDELAKKVPTARKVAEGIIQGTERGDFALCNDSLEASFLFANMIGPSPKRGFGLVTSSGMDRINWFSTRPPRFKVRPYDRDYENRIDVTDIYRNEAFGKSKAYLMTQSKPDVHSVFSALDKRIHRSRRKIVSTGLSEKSIRRFEPTMTSQIEIYLDNLKKAAQSCQPVNMTVACKYLALDISSLFGFGSSLKLQTNDRNRFIAEGMEAGMYRTNIHMQYPLSKYLGVDAFLLPFLFSIKERYKTALRAMIADRLTVSKDAREDLFSFITGIKDPETGDEISQNDLFAEAEFFLPAGGQTTSSAIAALFFYLAQNPECASRLIDEIRSTFTRGDQIEHNELSTCTYLRACIDEALRMSPPAPGTLWREISEDSQESVVVDGHVIPSGTVVGINIYAIHHNEEYFPNPSKFRPERFLPRSETATVSGANKTQQLAFSPFSIGTRGCIGKALAYMEISLVVAKTLWYFDFEEHPDHGTQTHMSPDPAQKEFKIRDQLIATHDGPYLVFRPSGKL
ncbi:uncharacterized protein N0V89_004544 [Didymosphaeria variabile]|uniref:Cytochrome P450 n=1 Tax=Didymosphaeria variabile TaxID=1932322 RepID=A0A9W8XSN6_9PLEO|nr:uncharacterized protein N0V89_004544 [Didymosphaeria variabile]KAJ4356510.1 hypothetical protein N0V89_004544 [Didymosphaeria variabile]